MNAFEFSVPSNTSIVVAVATHSVSHFSNQVITSFSIIASSTNPNKDVTEMRFTRLSADTHQKFQTYLVERNFRKI